MTKTVHLNSEKPHFQKHNRKTNPERYRMFGAERCTGTSPKQILLKINSPLYSKQLAEQSGSSVLHWIFFWSTRTAVFNSVNWVSTRFILQLGTVYCTVHWWLRAHNSLDPESLCINWPRNCIGTQKSRNFRKHIRETKPELHWILTGNRSTRKSPNQIQLKLIFLFILQEWLRTRNAA